MTPLEAPPPTKKRRINKAENSVCDKEELKSSFCKLGDDRNKVLEAARGGSQDVNVKLYSSNEVTLPDKKDRKIEKVWIDHKQGTRGTLQNCRRYIKKVKEDMAKARYAPRHDQLKHRPKHSTYKFSTMLKGTNLIDLLPRSKFHCVRKRTPFSYKTENIRTGARLYSPNGQVSELKWGATAKRGNYVTAPLAGGAAHNGTFPLVSQNLGRTATESELFRVCGVERKHSDRTRNLDFKGSTLDEGGLKVKRKITNAYVRNKYREPFFKDKWSDHYALHLLADTALNLGSEPIFHVQQKQEGESSQGCNEHEPLSSTGKTHASKVNTERNVGEGSKPKAASVIHKDLQLDEVPLNAHVLPKISNDTITFNSLMAGFHVTKETQEVATIADQKAHMPEIEFVDFHSSMCTQPSTLEGFQTTASNFEDVIKLSCAPSRKDTFIPEHRERIDETTVQKDSTVFKKDSECLREQRSVFVSVESVRHDKVSSTLCELDPCSTFRENSHPRLLTCMEKLQKSEGYPSSLSTKSLYDGSLEESLNYEGCPSSFNTSKFRNQSPGYLVREIVQSSKLKATRMVDEAVKVMSSTKVEDAYAMIGEALDSTGIQKVGVHSRISRLQRCSYLQNGGPGSFHQNLSCNPAEVASIVHSINSTVPTFSRNDSQISPKLISACVAALLMIQACSDTGLPPAEAMEILEHAARDLHPQFSQNLHIYREIEELMSIIKTQVLSLIRTPGLNL